MLLFEPGRVRESWQNRAPKAGQRTVEVEVQPCCVTIAITMSNITPETKPTESKHVELGKLVFGGLLSLFI